MLRKTLFAHALTAAILSGCAAPAANASSVSQVATASATAAPVASTQVPPVPSPTAQATATPGTYGPDSDRFPPNINPMTGLPVIDPELLKIPVVLVSISHFPAAGRPQAGLSFAPFVYEFSITKGETRFLTAFYGEFPEPENPAEGGCTVRTGAFRQTAAVLGNLVWLDANQNGAQDVGERGIPGICVSLRDDEGKIIQTTTTDTNGIYGFNAEAGRSYSLEFVKPAYFDFTQLDVGNEDSDSDVDPASGKTVAFPIGQGTRDWDAGMVLNASWLPAAPDMMAMPAAEVGPVRSGRLLYAHVAGSYTNSCLIYAFASPEILEKLPHCAFVSHEEANGGEMISTERMRAVAEDNMRHTAGRPFDYSSNAYSEVPPPGGTPASQLDVFFGNINQSGWIYDPLYQAYLRQVDDADMNARGVLHADVDRLTGRQLHFENVIVLMADIEVVTRTNLDIHLDAGNTGPAKLLRNGQVFSVTWSTRGGEYEKQTGVRKPIQFLNPDGSPAALKAGRTWVIIVTPFSPFEPQGNATYLIKYAPPAGEAQ